MKENTTSGGGDELLKRKKKDAAPPTKIVVRHLPPAMTAEEFLEQISPAPSYNFFYYAKSDPSLGPYTCCQAYFNFDNSDEIHIFQEKFDGYTFIDTKGNEYMAVVEYAPYQKVPKSKPRKADLRKGTIEEDNDYLKFLDSLKEEVETPSINSVLEEIEAREKEMSSRGTTPLIEYIKRRKEERRASQMKAREERRRKDDERRKAREDERRRREKVKVLKPSEQNKTRDNEKEKNRESNDNAEKRREYVEKRKGDDRKKTRDDDRRRGSRANREKDRAGSRYDDDDRSSRDKRKPRTEVKESSKKFPRDGPSSASSRMSSAHEKGSKSREVKEPESKSTETKQTIKSKSSSESSASAKKKEAVKEQTIDAKNAPDVATDKKDVTLTVKTNTSKQDAGSDPSDTSKSSAKESAHESVDEKQCKEAPQKRVRYKDRPERAIYVPGQRRREQQQKQQQKSSE